MYYSGIPNAIQVAEHTFVDLRVLNLFNAQCVFAWTSATNASHIYHEALSGLTLDDRSTARFHLRTEHVWDGFVIVALLKDAGERGHTLIVPHTGDQKDRFTSAMDTRNAHMRRNGQPEYAHWCTKCVRRYDHDDGTSSRHCFSLAMLDMLLMVPGYVDAMVTDGIEIGQPCCSVRHCIKPLRSTQDRYCPGHLWRDSICAVDDCPASCEQGFRTCPIPAHRAVESRYTMLHKAAFQLRARLQQSKVAQPDDSVSPVAAVDEAIEVELDFSGPPPESVPGNGCTDGTSCFINTPTDLHASPPLINSVNPTVSTNAPLPLAAGRSSPPTQHFPALSATVSLPMTSQGKPGNPESARPHSPCTEKPDEGNGRKLRGIFGRAHTHNDQLFVRPCGIMVERDICYGSETVPQIAVSPRLVRVANLTFTSS